MAIKIGDGQYKCMFCNKVYPNPAACDSHRDTDHEYVTVPFLKDELAFLIQFIYTYAAEEPDNFYLRTLVPRLRTYATTLKNRRNED